MSGFPILDLVVGIIFIYFILSIISSSIIELILTGLKARARMLEEWLFTIFDKIIVQPDNKQVTLGQAIMDHCSVTVLSGPGKSTSYIDARNFAAALLEKITFDPKNPHSIARNMDEFIAAIEKTKALSTEFQRVLLTYANEAKETYKSMSEKTVSELDLFRGKIENWYDSSMDRVTDVLKKRYSRPATLVVAIIVTTLLNADSVAIAKYLYSNPDTRSKLAAQAMDATKDSALIKILAQSRMDAADTSSAKSTAAFSEIQRMLAERTAVIEKAKQQLDGTMPLTWQAGELKGANGKLSARLILAKITGLLATIFAILMGAPFWFDILNKISNLRGSGAKPAPATSEEEKKKT